MATTDVRRRVRRHGSGERHHDEHQEDVEAHHQPVHARSARPRPRRKALTSKDGRKRATIATVTQPASPVSWINHTPRPTL